MELTKQIRILAKEIQDHNVEITRLQRAREKKDAEVNNFIFTVALTLGTMNQQRREDRMEDIFLEDDNQSNTRQQRRQTMAELTASLRLLYTLDCTAELSAQSRAVIEAETPDWLQVREIGPGQP